MAITFNFQTSIAFPSRRKVRTLVQEIFQREGVPLLTLNIIFCSDDYLLDLNRTYLSHDYYTDIITFDLSEAKQVEGEIYISVETATNNAKTYNVLLFKELCRLVIHGCLHLCGYSDKTKKDKILMSTKEDRYLSFFETI